MLSPDDLKRDTGVLTLAFEGGYGGKGILPGIEFDDLLRGFEELKNNQKTLSSDLLCDQISALFNTTSDYHLTAHIENRTCGRTWPQSTVGKNSGSGDQNRTWSSFSKDKNGKTISVLSLRAMSPDGSPEWNGFLDRVRDLVNTHQSFIIDLRGNGGGSMSHQIDMARILYGLSPLEEIPSPKKEVYRRKTAEASAILANYYWLVMQENESLHRTTPDYIKSGYQEFVQLDENAKKGLIPSVEVQKFGGATFDPARAVSIPIYVLIDRGCGSSCELALENLEKLPSVQTVGENTTGVLQYGFVGNLYLPSSHVIIHLPTQGTHYDDNRQVEKIGYAPKWRVPSGTDALDFTLETFFK